MSYCGPRWMSDWTFEHLLWQVSLLGQAGMQWASAAAGQEYLVAAGRIQSGLVTSDRPFYRLMRPAGYDESPGEGQYSIEQLDAAGQPLFVRRFELTADTLALNPDGGAFLEQMPWQQGTQQVVIRHGQTALLSVPVSAHAPQVTLTAPNGGEQWPAYGQRTVEWDGQDGDGDPLRYALQYSADGGATWRPIASNLTDEPYAVDLGALAGSDAARLRVVASDGLNTSSDETNAAFSVEGKPPAAAISSPRAGAAYPTGQAIILQGSASDLEDGAMTDETAFHWSSDRQGGLGIGRMVQVDQLRSGYHTITLRVVDSDMFAGEASVTIYVGTQTRLPLLLK